MARRLPGIIVLALRTVRASPLHTFLSTLGLIIGVGALVGVLALGDGLEQYARDQLSTTTDLHAILVTPRPGERVDGVYLRRERVPAFTPADVDTLAGRFGAAADVVVVHRGAAAVRLPVDTTRSAVYLQAFWGDAAAFARSTGATLVTGRFFTPAEARAGRPLLVVNEAFAARLPGGAVGQVVEVGGVRGEVVGVFAGGAGETPQATGPPAAFRAALPDGGAPTLVVRAVAVETVPALADDLETWLAGRFGTENVFDVVTNTMRVEQVRRGVLLFKLVMGLITGIAVVVGGVGVMNVLLIAVTERTREIGIRKAVGARRADVVWQFLTEAVAISVVGSALGLAAGLVGIFTAVPVIRHLTEVPFEAAFSWGTVLVVAVVAVAVGMLFGTYPAYRAARLAPVDAIRQE